MSVTEVQSVCRVFTSVISLPTEPRVHQRDHLQRAVHDRVSGLQDQPQHLPVQPAGGAEQLHWLLPPQGQEESRHATGQLHGVREPGKRPGAGHAARQNHVHTTANVKEIMMNKIFYCKKVSKYKRKHNLFFQRS